MTSSSAANRLLDTVSKAEAASIAPSITFTPTNSTASIDVANDHVECNERGGQERAVLSSVVVHTKNSNMGSSSQLNSLNKASSPPGLTSKKGIPTSTSRSEQAPQGGGPPSSTASDSNRFTLAQSSATSKSTSNVFSPSKGIFGGSFKFRSKNTSGNSHSTSTTAASSTTAGKIRVNPRKTQSSRAMMSSSSESHNQSNGVAFSPSTVSTMTPTTITTKEDDSKFKPPDVRDMEEKENRRRCSTVPESSSSSSPNGNLSQAPMFFSMPSALTWRLDPRVTFSDCKILVATEVLNPHEGGENACEPKLGNGEEAVGGIECQPAVFKDEKEEETTEEKLQDTINLDLAVQVETYHVHRCILAVAGRELLNLFHTASHDGTDNHPIMPLATTAYLTLKPSAAAAFPLLLDYIYDQQQQKTPIDIQTHNAMALRHLAKQFKITGLQRAANNFVKSDLNSLTATTYLSEAEVYGDEKVLAASIKLLARNLDQVDANQLKHLSQDVFCRLVTCPDVTSSSENLSLRVASFLKEQEERQEPLDAAYVHTVTKSEVLPTVGLSEALYFLKINQDYLQHGDEENKVQIGDGNDGDNGDEGSSLHDRCLRATSHAWKDVANLIEANRSLYPLPDSVTNDVLTSALGEASKEVSQVEELQKVAQRNEMKLRRVIFRVIRHVLDRSMSLAQANVTKKGKCIEACDLIDVDDLLSLSSSSSDWLGTRRGSTGETRNSTSGGTSPKGGRGRDVSVTGAKIQAVNGWYKKVGPSRYTNGMLFVELVGSKSSATSSSNVAGQKWVISLQDPDDRYRDRAYDIDLFEAPVKTDDLGRVQADLPPSKGWVVCGAGKQPAPLIKLDS